MAAASQPYAVRTYSVQVRTAPGQAQAGGLSLILVIIYCVFRLGAVHEFLASHGLVIHYNYVFVPALAIVSLLEGRFVRVFGRPIAKWMILFLIWMVVTTITSSWRGGSAQVLQIFFQDEFVLFLALAGVITSVAACRRFLVAATAAMCCVVTFALLSGGNSSFGRFGIEGSKFANPNDFSFHLIFLGCFVICFLATKRASIVASALALVGMGFLGLATIQFFRAGSRGGLVVLVALSALGWFRLQSNKKVVILVAAVAGVLMAPLVLPSTALARYSTIFGDDSNVTTAGEAQDVMVAEASSDARKATLWQSVDLTREHPIVGVGPGEFADVMEKKFKAMSRFRIYTGTHNSYTQISSEMGIPGLFFFVAILWTSYRSLKKTREITRGKPDLAVVHNMAWAVTFALLAFVIGSLFVHYGFTTYMPMVAALSVGLAQAADNTVQTT